MKTLTRSFKNLRSIQNDYVTSYGHVFSSMLSSIQKTVDLTVLVILLHQVTNNDVKIMKRLINLALSHNIDVFSVSSEYLCFKQFSSSTC